MRGLLIGSIAAALGLSGCAGAKITPAVNKVDAVQTSSGPSERTVITIGETARPKGAK